MPNSINNPGDDVAIWKRIMLDSCLTPYTKIKPISIKDLMVKNKQTHKSTRRKHEIFKNNLGRRPKYDTNQEAIKDKHTVLHKKFKLCMIKNYH